MAVLNTSIINFETGEIVRSGIIGRQTQVVQRSTGTNVINKNTPANPITDMTISPPSGTYLAQFNGQFRVLDTSSVTSQAKTDLIALYDELSALTATVTNHASDYGNGESLGPGVYTQAAASTITGTLTLNGGGDANSLFVFRSVGAFSTAASSTVVLTNGATSSNVWFVSEGAASTGANSVMKGSLLANVAAASTGAGSSIEGRLFAITGAPSLGAITTMTEPVGTNVSTVGGTLVEFSIFAGTGDVSNAGASTIPLNIGTDSGTITGFDDATVSGVLYPGGASTIGKLFYGIYLDGVLIPETLRNSTRPYLAIGAEFPIVLQSVIKMTPGQTIDVRVYATIGEMVVTAAKSFVLIPINPPIYL